MVPVHEAGLGRVLDQLAEEQASLRNRPVDDARGVRGIIAKTVGVQGVMIEALAKIGSLRQSWLYTTNSHPPGEGTGPIHLLIVGGVDLTELNEAITRLEGHLGREINYTVFDEGEFQRRRAEADPFLTEILGGRNVLLIGRDDGV